MLKFKTIYILALITFLNMQISFASNNIFNPNYKNINSISSMICEGIQPERSHNRITRSEININKIQLSSNPHHINYEISGYCNSIFSKSNKTLIKLGDEINLEAKFLKSKISFKGQVGLNQINLFFKGKSPEKLIISNKFSLTRKIYDFKKSKWALNDSLFKIGNNSSLVISVNNKKKIKEKNLQLKFAKNHYHYNIWSFNSFGCSSKTSVSKDTCEKLGKDS